MSIIKVFVIGGVVGGIMIVLVFMFLILLLLFIVNNE